MDVLPGKKKGNIAQNEGTSAVPILKHGAYFRWVCMYYTYTQTHTVGFPGCTMCIYSIRIRTANKPELKDQQRAILLTC